MTEESSKMFIDNVYIMFQYYLLDNPRIVLLIFRLELAIMLLNRAEDISPEFLDVNLMGVYSIEILIALFLVYGF